MIISLLDTVYLIFFRLNLIQTKIRITIIAINANAYRIIELFFKISH